MGPAWSDAELDEILMQEPCSVLSACSAGELVGVVSVVYPDDVCSSYGITGLAVNPANQRQGIASMILSKIQSYCCTKPGQEWIAFVHLDNESAHKFMEKQGWHKGDTEGEMFRYSYTQ